MVKGTSRQVIVVHAPEEKLFDQAIFLLKEGAVENGGVSDEALLREAKRYLEAPGKRKAKWLHNGPLWGAAGAGIGLLLSLIL
ncbi:MAG: translation initiation factor 2 [Oscillospiraceae bacterium]|nr:translation initiation factor 2 [Oscillospiraceae bacterium]